MLCFRKDDDPKAVSKLAEFIEEVVSPWRKRTSAAKDKATGAKNQRDADKLEKVASPEAIKHAVRAAMVDLRTLAETYEGEGQMPPRAKQIATKCMVGILANNQLMGRNQEWETAQAEHVRQELASGRPYFTTTSYKTSKQYGAYGKYMAPGTRAALQVYLNLPGKRTQLLLEPSLDKSKQVQVSTALHGFFATYLPGHVGLDKTRALAVSLGFVVLAELNKYCFNS